RVTLWQNSNTLFQYSPAPATLAQMGFKQVIVPLVGWDPWAAKPSSGMTALQYAQKARQLTAGLPLWLGTSVTHRQANAALPPHMVPWIDDAAWSVSLKNLTELCKAAEAVGAVGIAIDSENYAAYKNRPDGSPNYGTQDPLLAWPACAPA